MAQKKTGGKKAKKAAPKAAPKPEPTLGERILKEIMNGDKNGVFHFNDVEAIVPDVTYEQILECSRRISRSRAGAGFVLL
jgi:hypothetical protein